LQQQSPPTLYGTIKDEPPSPPSISPNEIILYPQVVQQAPIVQQTPAIVPVTTVSNTSQIKQTNTVKKVPISRTFPKARPIAPLHGKITNTLPKASLSTMSVTSNTLPLKNLPSLPLKTEQLNTALLAGEKYSIPPKIVKLGIYTIILLFCYSFC